MNFDFPFFLLAVTIVTGLLSALDRYYFEKIRINREANAQEPLIFEYSKSFFPVFAIVFVLRSFIVEPFTIPSGSMLPTLKIGDFILVNKFSYGLRMPVFDYKFLSTWDIKRGDVVVFKYPVDPSLNYIKRVVGLPGDTIRYTTDKKLYVNNELVPYQILGADADDGGLLYAEQLEDVSHKIRINPNIGPAVPRDIVATVPQDYYYMMGDNRDNSHDSRYWYDEKLNRNMQLQGMVPDKYILGKAFAIWMYWPSPKLDHFPSLSRLGLIK